MAFATNKNGAGFEHWPYYQSYLDAGIDRLYEMGTYSNHSGKNGLQPGDRENVTRQLLNYPLKNTAFGLGDYKSCDNDVSFPSDEVSVIVLTKRYDADIGLPVCLSRVWKPRR
jgi:hypothetical protein